MTTRPADERRQQLREVLIRRRRAELAGGGVVAVGRDGLLPLSWQQLGLWFLYEWDRSSATYHLPLVLRLRGGLDVSALGLAVSAVVSRHEGLRTRFVVSDGQPWQVVDPAVSVVPRVVGLPSVGWEVVVSGEVSRPFELGVESGFRLFVGRLGVGDHVVVLNCHHIVSDGWSVGIVSGDVRAAYAAAVAGSTDPLLGLSPLPVQPADYAFWQHQHRDTLDASIAYWTGQLAELPTLALPADRARQLPPTGAGDGLTGWIDATTGAGVTALAARWQVSPLAVLLAGFTVLLWRYTGQADLPVGSVFSGRTRTQLEPLVGYFANTVVLRTRIDPAGTLEAHVRQCQHTVLGAMEHQDAPFTLVVDAVRPVRVPGRNPLFQTAFSLLPAALGTDPGLDGLTTESVSLPGGTSRFDLTLQVGPQPDGSMAVAAEYATELFDRERIKRMLRHLRDVLAEMVAAPSGCVDDLLVLDQAAIAGEFTSATPPVTTPGANRHGRADGDTLQALTAIWAEVLGVAVAPEANFFTEGGSSLALARLTAAIEDRLGVRLDVRDLYLAPTLAAMAALVSERGADPVVEESKTSLVRLHGGGRRPPLFLIHAIGGSVVPYLPLVELLDAEQPVYAFEAAGLHGGQAAKGTVADVAAGYLRELRAVQPEGPYRLAGWSVGGIIARQLAFELRAIGAEVELLVLIDAVPADLAGGVPDQAGLLSWFVHDLIGIAGGQVPELPETELRTVPDPVTHALEHLVKHGVIDDADRTETAARYEVFAELAEAFLRHRPQPVDVETHLLAAADGAVDPVSRWRAIGGPVTVHPVDGNHYTMLQPPQLDSVVTVLNKLLANTSRNEDAWI